MSLFESDNYCVHNLLYSCVYGRGIYQITDTMVENPLPGNRFSGTSQMSMICDGGAKPFSPLVRNIFTGEEFYIQRINCIYESQYLMYIDMIRHPADRTRILWPVDMVDLTNTKTDGSLYALHEYNDITETRYDNRGLLFPYCEYDNIIDWDKRFQTVETLSWKNSEVRKIAYQILYAIDNLNRQGYVYNDIHLSRIFFTKDDSVYLDFSGLIFPFNEIFGKHSREICSVHGHEYPVEFAAPWVYNNKSSQKVLGFCSQNFSIAALLFYLFMGRYPYDGRLLDGYRDDDIKSHYNKFRTYIKSPIFIFDPDQKQNALGTFSEEEALLSLWDEMPRLLKSVFISTLRESNATRSNEKHNNPTPFMWMDYLNSVGWHNRTEV